MQLYAFSKSYFMLPTLLCVFKVFTKAFAEVEKHNTYSIAAINIINAIFDNMVIKMQIVKI